MAVLATDISGSSITIAYTNYLQDGATRRFLTSSTSRVLAITEVKTTLIAEQAGSGGTGYRHPDYATFSSTMVVNRITATAVGPDRWVVSVEYVATKFGGFSGGSGQTLMNAKVSHESVQVYCAPTSFVDGLPYGGNGTDFLHPGGPAGQSTDPQDPPRAYMWSRPIAVIQIPFSQTTNPFNQNALANTGKLLPATTLAGIPLSARKARFDGADISAISNSGGTLGSTTFSGIQHYSVSMDGFFQQVLKWNDDGGWYCDNEPAFENQ